MACRAMSFRTRFTLWGIVSLVLLPAVAMLAATGIQRFVGAPIADRALEADAGRLAAALPACLGARHDAGSDRRCLDETLATLFPRHVAYAQLSELPAAGTAPVMRARSRAMQALVFSFSPAARPALGRGQAFFESIPPYGQETSNRVITLSVPGLSRPAYVLQLGLDLFEEQHEPWMKWPHVFWFTLPLLLLGGTIWGFFFMKRVFAPVHEIVALAQRISAEDLSHRIEGVESDDEIGELAATLNAMIARLSRSFQQMEQFSSDVAHELRTPLTIIKGEVEVALKRERSADDYRAVLGSLLEEAERLGAMIEDLLLLARMESGRQGICFGAVELDVLLLESYEQAAALGRSKGVAVALEPLDDVCVLGEPGLLRRLLANLLSNAVRYTPSGGRVTVSLAATAEEVRVSVSDTGCGIPEQALGRVFDRFYRVDPSRSQETGGTGLGLAIVQKIAAAHEAKLDVESRVGFGSTFHVTFRRAGAGDADR